MLNLKKCALSIWVVSLASYYGVAAPRGKYAGSDRLSDKFSLDDLKKLYELKDYEISEKKTVWLILDLKEPANISFFAPGKEISSHIVKGVISGKIIPYEDEKCTIKMTHNNFLKNLRDPRIINYDESHEFKSVKSKNVAQDNIPSEDERFLPRDICRLKIMAEVIVDNVRADVFYRIISIGVVVPGNDDEGGASISRDIAFFDYRDLIAYFVTIDPNESWINPENSIENKTFAEALTNLNLWLPQAYMVDDEASRIRGIDYNGGNYDLEKKALHDYESKLWVY